MVFLRVAVLHRFYLFLNNYHGIRVQCLIGSTVHVPCPALDGTPKSTKEWDL